MPKNEIAFIVLVVGAFFLVVAIRGFFEWLTDWLFDRARIKPNFKEFKKAAMLAALASMVCFLSWSFI